MGHDPAQEHDANPDEPQDHAERPAIIGSDDDVIHVPHESRQGHERHVNDDEDDVAEHRHEMHGAGGLPAAEPREVIDERRRHGESRRNRQRTHQEHHAEIGQLLQRVVPVIAVRFRRKVEIGIVHEGAPCLNEYGSRGRHEPLPLGCAEQQADEDQARDDESVDIQEVPRTSDADRMAISRQGGQRRDIPGIIFRGPDPILRNRQRGQSDPFRSGRAVVVEIQARMIHEDRQAAANQHREEQKIEEVAVANPHRKAMRSCCS